MTYNVFSGTLNQYSISQSTDNIPISEVKADQLMDKLKNSTILIMMTI